MSRRTARVNELLRERLSEIIMRDLKDPRISGLVTVTSVEVSPDLSAARVYVSVLGDRESKGSTLAGLRSASRFMHKGLEDLALRRVPDLTFVLDETMERADHMLRLMDKVKGYEERGGR
jgi:ribosome-binding factor A